MPPFSILNMCACGNRYLFLLGLCLALSEEKAVNAIMALMLVMVVREIPWTFKTDDGPVYASQQFNDFLESWKISHTTGILKSSKKNGPCVCHTA